MADDPILVFLHARIQEDERAAHAAIRDWDETVDTVPAAAAAHVERHDPGRALRYVRAIRQILDGHQPIMDTGALWCAVCTHSWPCATIRALAGIYASHPDFLERWA